MSSKPQQPHSFGQSALAQSYRDDAETASPGAIEVLRNPSRYLNLADRGEWALAPGSKEWHLWVHGGVALDASSEPTDFLDRSLPRSIRIEALTTRARIQARASRRTSN